jgi:hypothetical protein
VEGCAGFELITIENATALGDGSLEIGEGLEGAVREQLIQDGPEVLGGLQFGRVSGQVDEPEPIRHGQVGRGVPAGVVEPEHDEAIPSRPASRANSARSAAKNGLDTPFDTDQKVSPEIGCTEAVPDSPYSGDGQARWAAGLWAPTLVG